MMNNFVLKVRRKETPFYQFIYSIASYVFRINIPNFVLPIYKILYMERQLRINSFRRIITLLYYEPMFRCRCKKVGKNLNYMKLQQGFPYIAGNIQLYFGDYVTVHSRSTFSATKIFDFPVFKVGDNTYLGPGYQ